MSFSIVSRFASCSSERIITNVQLLVSRVLLCIEQGRSGVKVIISVLMHICNGQVCEHCNWMTLVRASTFSRVNPSSCGFEHHDACLSAMRSSPAPLPFPVGCLAPRLGFLGALGLSCVVLCFRPRVLPVVFGCFRFGCRAPLVPLVPPFALFCCGGLGNFAHCNLKAVQARHIQVICFFSGRVCLTL